MTPSERSELTRELLALRSRLERLEARQGRGDSQYLAGAAVSGRQPISFFDGTYVDEYYPDDPQYHADATYYAEGHVDFYGHDDGARNLYDGEDREVYLRLERPVRVRGRPVVFGIYLGRFWGEVHSFQQYEAVLRLELITAEFSQAILEAMTWNNKLAVTASHLLGTLSTDEVVYDAFALQWGGAYGGGNPGVAVTARIPSVDATLTGVRICAELTVASYGPPPVYHGESARARILSPKEGIAVPGRAFLVVE